MTEVQEKLLQLLTEIDEICKQENIRYYLSNDTAHGAVAKQGFYSQGCQAHIAMTTVDMGKFMAAVKKENREGRAVDSLLTNKTYPDFTLRYCDSDTTMIQLPYKPRGVLPCVGVTIHPIRYKTGSGLKFYSLTKKVWECCEKKAIGRSAAEQAVIIACRTAVGVVGRHFVSRFLFKRWSKIFAPNKAKTFALDSSKFVFPTACLKNAGTAVLEGKEFPVFGDVEAYLNKFYNCPDFREKVPNYKKESLELLISVYVPYRKYLQQAQTMGIDFKAVNQNLREYEKLQQIVGGENKKISKYYAIVERTQRRFEMYEKYMPIKKILMQLYEQQRYEELNALLRPYRSALRSCQKKGLGLCFDKDIFHMTMHMLRLEGKDAYAKKLQALVPQQHWEPMVVTDYKGQLVEITELDQLPEELLSSIEELQND